MNIENLKGLKIVGVVPATENIDDDCLILENGLCLFVSKWELACMEDAKDVLSRQMKTLEQAAESYKSLADGLSVLKPIEEEKAKALAEELKAQEAAAAATVAIPPQEIQGDSNGTTAVAVQSGEPTPPA